MIINFSNLGGGGGGSYTLPVATSEVLGGVKIGSGVTVDSGGTISVPEVEQDYKIVSATTDYKVGKMYAVVTNTGSTSFTGNPEYTLACGKDVYTKGQIADTSAKYVFNPYLGMLGYGSGSYIDLYIQKEALDEHPTLMVKYGNSIVINETFTGNSINVSLPEVTGKYSIFGGVALTAFLEEDNYVSIQLQGDGVKNCRISRDFVNYNINIQNVYTEVEQIEKLDSLEYMEDSVWSNNIYMIEGNQYIERLTGSDNMHKKLRVAGMAAKTNFNNTLNEGDVMAYKYTMGWIFDETNNGFNFRYAKGASGWWIGDIYPIHIGYSGDTQINLRLRSNGDGLPQYIDIYRGDNPDDRIEQIGVESWYLPTTVTANNYDLKIYLARTTGDTYNTASFLNFEKASDDTPIELDYSDADLNETIVSDLYKKTASGWTKVVDIPVASSNAAGIVKVGDWGGLSMDGNEIKVKSLPQRTDVYNGQIANISWNTVGQWINTGSSANTFIIDLTYIPLGYTDQDFWCGSFNNNGNRYNVRISQINPISLRYKVMDDSWSTIFTAATTGDGVYNIATGEPYEVTITVDANIVTVEINSGATDVNMWNENAPILVVNMEGQCFPYPVRPKLGTGLKYNVLGEIELA